LDSATNAITVLVCIAASFRIRESNARQREHRQHP